MVAADAAIQQSSDLVCAIFFKAALALHAATSVTAASALAASMASLVFATKSCMDGTVAGANAFYVKRA